MFEINFVTLKPGQRYCVLFIYSVLICLQCNKYDACNVYTPDFLAPLLKALKNKIRQSRLSKMCLLKTHPGAVLSGALLESVCVCLLRCPNDT